MDLDDVDSDEDTIVMLTPSKSWSGDMKLKVYDWNTFHRIISTYQCRQNVESNSVGSQFGAHEKIECDMILATQTQTDNQNPDNSTQVLHSELFESGALKNDHTQTTESTPDVCDNGVQVNMQQTGVVRPVVRDAEVEENPRNPAESQTKSVEDVARREGRVTYMNGRMKKYQMLVRKLAKDTPSAEAHYLRDYFDSIYDLWRTISSGEGAQQSCLPSLSGALTDGPRSICSDDGNDATTSSSRKAPGPDQETPKRAVIRSSDGIIQQSSASSDALDENLTSDQVMDPNNKSIKNTDTCRRDSSDSVRGSEPPGKSHGKGKPHIRLLRQGKNERPKLRGTPRKSFSRSRNDPRLNIDHRTGVQKEPRFPCHRKPIAGERVKYRPDRYRNGARLEPGYKRHPRYGEVRRESTPIQTGNTRAGTPCRDEPLPPTLDRHAVEPYGGGRGTTFSSSRTFNNFEDRRRAEGSDWPFAGEQTQTSRYNENMPTSSRRNPQPIRDPRLRKRQALDRRGYGDARERNEYLMEAAELKRRRDAEVDFDDLRNLISKRGHNLSLP